MEESRKFRNDTNLETLVKKSSRFSEASTLWVLIPRDPVLGVFKFVSINKDKWTRLSEWAQHKGC